MHQTNHRKNDPFKVSLRLPSYFNGFFFLLLCFRFWMKRIMCLFYNDVPFIFVNIFLSSNNGPKVTPSNCIDQKFHFVITLNNFLLLLLIGFPNVSIKN